MRAPWPSVPFCLTFLTTLQTFYISHISIGDEGTVALRAFSAVLSPLTALQTFYISHISIGDEGTVAFSAVLSHLTALQTFYISHISFGDEGTVALRASWAVTTLQEFVEIAVARN
jgi:hypothetical protein